MMTLRHYQEEAIRATMQKWGEFNSLLLVMPTGAGKTIVFSHIVKQRAAAGFGKSLILAHREELIVQAGDKLRAATGIFAGVEMADMRATPRDEAVVASVQSMVRRLDKWKPDAFGTVIVDEAHHALSPTYQKVLDHFKGGGAQILGVTATPDRGDKRSLSGAFDEVAYEVSLFTLIKESFLAPIKIRTVPFTIDLGTISKRGGDFKDEEVGAAIAPFMRQISELIVAHAWDRKTLIFLPLRKISRACVDHLRELGVSAEHVDGDSPDRAAILRRYARGETQFLSNAMLLTEGYDDPPTDCIVPLRATSSRSLYSQMVGRGTRTSPGKTDLTILDFLWHHERHSLCKPSCLVAESSEVAEAMDAAGDAGGAGGEDRDLFEVLAEAKQSEEDRLRKKLEDAARDKKGKVRTGQTIDAMDYALTLHDLSAASWEPTMPWHSDPVTDKQVTTLLKFGIDPSTCSCKGHANAILGSAFARSKMGLASPKQVAVLRRFGHPSPETATRAEASGFLDAKFGKRK